MFSFYTWLSGWFGGTSEEPQQTPIKRATKKERKQGKDLQKDVIENKYYAWKYDYRTQTLTILDYSKDILVNNDGLAPKCDYNSMNSAMVAIHENAVRREVVKYQIDTKSKVRGVFYDIMKNVLNKTNELVDQWMIAKNVIILETTEKNTNYAITEPLLLTRRNEPGKNYEEIRYNPNQIQGSNTSTTPATLITQNIKQGNDTTTGLKDILQEIMFENASDNYSDDYEKLIKTWCDGADRNDIDSYMTKNFTGMIKFRLAALTELDDTGNDLLTYDKVLPYERDLHINDIESHFDELHQVIKIWWQALYNGCSDNDENKHNVFSAFILPLVNPRETKGVETYEKNLEMALKSAFPFGKIKDIDAYFANVRKTMKLFKQTERLTALPTENITDMSMRGPILSYQGGWCIGESASIIQQAVDLCRLVCDHSLEFKIQDPAYILHELFLGWEHSTIRASRRTVHAILCGKLRQKVIDYYNNQSFHAISPTVKESNKHDLQMQINNYHAMHSYVTDGDLLLSNYDPGFLLDAAKEMNKALRKNVNPMNVLKNIGWLIKDDYNFFWFKNGNLVAENERDGQKTKWLEIFLEYYNKELDKQKMSPITVETLENTVKKFFNNENGIKLDNTVFQEAMQTNILLDACDMMTKDLHPNESDNLLPLTVLQNIIWLNNDEHNIFWFENGNLLTDEAEKNHQKKKWLEKFSEFIDKALAIQIKNTEKQIHDIDKDMPKNEVNYELLMSLKETPSSNLPPLVSYAPVIIHGPRPNAVATQCFIQEILILTEEGKRIKNLLENTVDDVMRVSKVTSKPIGSLAYIHRNKQRQNKKARTMFDFDDILGHWRNNLTVVVSAMNNLQLTHSISSDAGRIQRNMHSLDNLKLQLALAVKQLIYTVPPEDKSS